MILGEPADIRDLCLSPPPMPRMRDLTKGKGVALPAAPTEILLGENPDAALARRLQQEEQIAEAVWSREDPKFLCTAQRLAAAEEEHLGVDTTTLVIVENEIPIAKRMEKKRRQIITGHPNYAAEEEEG